MYVKLFLDIKKDSGGWNIYRRKELFPLNCILIRILKFNKWTQYVQLFGGDEETTRMWGNQIATQSAIFRFWCHTLQTYSVEVLLQLNCHSISAKNLKVWESIIKFTKQFSSLAWVCNTLQSDMYNVYAQVLSWQHPNKKSFDFIASNSTTTKNTTTASHCYSIRSNLKKWTLSSFALQSF